MVKKTLLFMFVVAPLLAAILIGGTVWFLYQQKYTGPDVVFTVQQGDTFGLVNARLARQNIITIDHATSTAAGARIVPPI
jgi:cell division protein YceG involved in septum cleavage